MSMQQSDKHSPEVDDALQDQRRQSSEGTRHQGRAQDDGAEADEAPEGATVIHAEIARFLGQAAFPGDAARMRAIARMHEATEEVLRLLAQLPDGRIFHTTGEVVDAIPGLSMDDAR